MSAKSARIVSNPETPHSMGGEQSELSDDDETLDEATAQMARSQLKASTATATTDSPKTKGAHTDSKPDEGSPDLNEPSTPTEPSVNEEFTEVTTHGPSYNKQDNSSWCCTSEATSNASLGNCVRTIVTLFMLLYISTFAFICSRQQHRSDSLTSTGPYTGEQCVKPTAISNPSMAAIPGLLLLLPLMLLAFDLETKFTTSNYESPVSSTTIPPPRDSALTYFPTPPHTIDRSSPYHAATDFKARPARPTADTTGQTWPSIPQVKPCNTHASNNSSNTGDDFIHSDI
jgi:hypothetical protein